MLASPLLPPCWCVAGIMCASGCRFGNAIDQGNWDAVSGFLWWMEPGYAMTAYFGHFGGAFTHPWFSGFTGFLDGLYATLWGDGLWGGEVLKVHRPPWNYELMAAGYLLALLPMAFVLLGGVRAAWRFTRWPDGTWLLLLGTAGGHAGRACFHDVEGAQLRRTQGVFTGLVALLPLCAFGAAGWEFIARRGKIPALLLTAGLAVWAANELGLVLDPTLGPGHQNRSWRAHPGKLRPVHAQADGNNTEALRHAVPKKIEARKRLAKNLFDQEQKLDEDKKNHRRHLQVRRRTIRGEPFHHGHPFWPHKTN